MTQIILKDCENVTIKNISFDYINSTVAEITMVEQGKGYIDCTVGTGCCYKIIDGQIVWFGKNFFFSGGLTQIFDPETGYTWRHWGPMQDKTAVWQELSPNLIRISYDCDEPETNPYGVKTGNILQLRDPLRDECGIIIDNCVNTTFVNTTMYFMNGLGVIAQNSNGIYFNGFNSFPSIGRNTACFADFMHFSGCRGLIEI